ncbi:MAG: hypothetical protein JWP89_5623, partial [Schlesneria sp.]|nr:hypothetical protein [Schlesneria sp.]
SAIFNTAAHNNTLHQCSTFTTRCHQHLSRLCRSLALPEDDRSDSAEDLFSCDYFCLTYVL